MFNHSAFIEVDMQRGFMPAEEGSRLQLDGFGELGVPDGETLVPLSNKFLGWAALHGYNIATTQDWHPYETAHFAVDGEAPDFTTTWPRHCVDGTPGAELHPGLVIPPTVMRFTKGSEVLEHGEDDLSYSGYYAEDPISGQPLPEWLAARQITSLAVGGLALDYCVGRTAYDFRTKTALEVTLLTDLTKPVTSATGDAMLAKLRTAGVHLITSIEYMHQAEVA
jgi:nicotinamidase/pyrazinamidase